MDIIIINVKNKAKNEKSERSDEKNAKKCLDVVNVEKYVHILVKTNNLSWICTNSFMSQPEALVN